MPASDEQDWMNLLQDINDTLAQIEGGHQQVLSGDQSWLDALKDSPTFSRLSPEKLAAVMMKLEEVPVRLGDVVVRQKDPGDYFYIVKSGKFTVSRRTAPGEVQIVAQLEDGDSFGEASLLSGEPRNASIVADTDGTLVRLSRDDFDKLVRTDMVHHVSYPQAQEMIRNGAQFLDVRRDNLGGQDVLDGALVIPIDQLRTRIGEIKKETLYVIYCLNGGMSETAAFVLGERGYNVAVLRGGLNAIR